LTREEKSWYYALALILLPEVLDIADGIKNRRKKINKVGDVQVSTNES
jgi:hypothetical protein